MTESSQAKARVAVIRAANRSDGIPSAIRLLGINPVSGKDVLLKPNFNTADPFPGSTHNDTLRAIVTELRRMGSGRITVGERSGPPDTIDVIREKGIDKLAAELDLGLINFEDLPEKDWVHVKPKSGHWFGGFDVARPVVEAPCVVATGCLKTHGYGGVFTMSLKLAIGITHKRNMAELHGSIRSMEKMIAEVNIAWSPALIILDGIEAFVDGGPMTGTRKRADVILAATDRIAIDAVGLAVLRDLGCKKAIMDKPVFEQGQIARAVELGLGVSRPEDIEMVSDDDEGRIYSERLRRQLV